MTTGIVNTLLMAAVRMDGALTSIIAAGDPGGSLKTAIEAWLNVIKTVAPVLAVLSMSLFLLSIVVAPALPEWASGMKGYFQRALLALFALGIVGTIIGFTGVQNMQTTVQLISLLPALAP